jgi:hypothetical protein
MGTFIDLTGRTYGRLTVVRRLGTQGRNILWLCECACGESTTVTRPNLQSGHTRSCGCLVNAQNATHSMSRSRVYRIWKNMLSRCHNTKSTAWQHYGGRGIAVCDQWRQAHGFARFISDMGEPPSKAHSIDRIDNDGPYSPDNCRWATRNVQSRNKRSNRTLTWNGLTMPVIDWCKRTGIPKNTLLTRLNRGWSVQRALTTAVQVHSTKKPE